MHTHFRSSFPSADGVHNIAYYVVFPVGEIKGVIQISHGMCEYFERYYDFADFLADNGFVVCGNDHLGHGNSIKNKDELGYFSKKNGWENAVNDMYTLTKIMKKNYPALPYFLLGHSMGSFLARAFVTKCGKLLDGVVFSGTSGGMNGSSAMLAYIDTMKKLHGDKYRSKLVDKLAFGLYNKKIDDRKTDFDWISRDSAIVSKYCKDDKCGFVFTLNGFENLVKVLWYVTNDKWFETYPDKLPTFLVSGASDPVGDYGKGILRVFNKLNIHDCSVEMKIYKDARHEVINEINRDEVYNDILDFAENIISTKYRTVGTDSTENSTESM